LDDDHNIRLKMTLALPKYSIGLKRTLIIKAAVWDWNHSGEWGTNHVAILKNLKTSYQTISLSVAYSSTAWRRKRL
jgi:hypothetical protein